jgi:endonuclease/exonuclease/phosphatase family metal-dependent hydrolase
MPAFAKPDFDFRYQVATEAQALAAYRDTQPGRAIPSKAPNRLMLVSWNIANLGLHDRHPRDYRLIAEIIRWFDIAAIQEVNDNLDGLRAIEEALGDPYKVVFSDRAGNNERLAVIYDSSKANVAEMVAEIAVPAADKRFIKISGVNEDFNGFDRNPHIVTFDVGDAKFAIVNVHLYFGQANSRERRALEAYAVGRWCDLRRKSDHAYTKAIFAIGDFNIPKVEPGDDIYKALTKRGLQLPTHSTRVASAIASDAQYDQVAFMPGPAKDAYISSGVFDYDGGIFARLWDDPQRSEADFKEYLRYYISDHRPLWVEFAI